MKLSKATPFPKGTQVAARDQFQSRLYDVKKPRCLCYPVVSTGDRFKNPVALLMCYEIKPAKGELKHAKLGDQVRLHNRFGVEHVDTIKEDVLCVPAKGR